MNSMVAIGATLSVLCGVLLWRNHFVHAGRIAYINSLEPGTPGFSGRLAVLKRITYDHQLFDPYVWSKNSVLQQLVTALRED